MANTKIKLNLAKKEYERLRESALEHRTKIAELPGGLTMLYYIIARQWDMDDLQWFWREYGAEIQ